MIKARHHKAAGWIFEKYIMRLLKKSFDGFHLFGEIPHLQHSTPLLLLPNHNTWWDGFFVYLLNRQLFHRNMYIMMLEEQLRRYWFFNYLGAYSIEPGAPKSVAKSLNYSREILERDENSLVCIFPQGVLSPWEQRPLNFGKGISNIIEKTNASVYLQLLAMKVELREKQRPEVYFKLGQTIKIGKNTEIEVDQVETLATELLDELVKDIHSKAYRVDLLHDYKLLTIGTV